MKTIKTIIGKVKCCFAAVVRFISAIYHKKRSKTITLPVGTSVQIKMPDTGEWIEIGRVKSQKIIVVKR